MLMFFVQVFVLILQAALAEPNFRVSKCVSTIVRWEWAPLERIIYSSGTKSKGAQKQRCWICLIRTSNRLLIEFETKKPNSCRNANSAYSNRVWVVTLESKIQICFFSCCNPGQPAGQHPFRWETWQKKVKTSSLVKRQGNVNKK